ncbi:MAG TPA: glycosyltransferase family 1 protein [Microvirga sp.]|jgi:glycosyltransferase involved in cell wall biosynthesis|nr:glycosyltransferase family 1 protein [Microvirga sp.]
MAEIILFDLTRLVVRLRLETPTGIDRVEFAYARYLSERYRDQVRYLMRWRGSYRVIPTALVIGYLDSLEHQWGMSQPNDVRRLARQVGQFLGDPRIAKDCEGSDVKATRRESRRLWRTRLRMSLVSQRLRLPPRSEGESRIYVNVSHEGLHATRNMAQWIERDGLRPVFLLHDLIPVTHPEYVRDGHAARHANRLATMLKHGASILTNSAFTATELRRYAAGLGLRTPPVDVALLSAGFTDHAAPAEVDPGTPYFVVVGTIEPRKNHIFLLHVWRQMAERFGAGIPKLLIIGRRGWENENAIDLIERCAAIHDHVLECGSVPDAVLQRLMKGATAVLFPSFVEGYGMPLAEALMLGVPVIASDIDVFREIAGDIPEFANPLDGPAWSRLVQDYAQPGSARRLAQVERLRAFRAPTWDEHFEVFETALDRVRRTGGAPEAAPDPAPLALAAE